MATTVTKLKVSKALGMPFPYPRGPENGGLRSNPFHDGVPMPLPGLIGP